MELHECERIWKSFLFVGFVVFNLHATILSG